MVESKKFVSLTFDGVLQIKAKMPKKNTNAHSVTVRTGLKLKCCTFDVMKITRGTLYEISLLLQSAVVSTRYAVVPEIYVAKVTYKSTFLKRSARVDKD